MESERKGTGVRQGTARSRPVEAPTVPGEGGASPRQPRDHRRWCAKALGRGGQLDKKWKRFEGVGKCLWDREPGAALLPARPRGSDSLGR